MKTRKRRRPRRDKGEHPWRAFRSMGFSAPAAVKQPDVPMPHHRPGRRWAL